MGKRVLWLFLGLSLMASVAVSQKVPAGLINAFKYGRAQELSAFLAGQVELISPDGTQMLDRAKTANSLGSFFANHPPKDFIVNHQGERGESGFLVATFTTASESFRLNIFFKKENEAYLIHQIRIDKTHE